MTATVTGERVPVEPQLLKSKRVARAKVDLAAIPTVPFAMVNEHVYAAIRGCSEKVAQRERQEGVGCKYKKIGGSVRYRIADIFDFIDAQPGGGGNAPAAKRGPGRPRKAVA
jgi:hypothetical protein